MEVGALPEEDLGGLHHRLAERRMRVDRQLEIAENWRPYRAVAARCLWHYYLSGYVK